MTLRARLAQLGVVLGVVVAMLLGATACGGAALVNAPLDGSVPSHMRCVGAKWAVSDPALVSASTPAEAATNFTRGLAGGRNMDAIVALVDRRLIESATPVTDLDVDAATRRLTLTNFPDDALLRGNWVVQWNDVGGSLELSVVSHPAFGSDIDATLSLDTRVSPENYLTALGVLAGGISRTDPAASSQTAVRPFRYHGKRGVVVAWWSNREAPAGEVFPCLGT